ncbi:MAG: ribbon-helix-helix domain-containing protein [Candidatus Methanomethyliaceae archaeon]
MKIPKRIKDEKISWTSVNIPVPLSESVLEFVEKYKHLGYVSYSEFIREAIREKLEREYEKIEKLKKKSETTIQQ